MRLPKATNGYEGVSIPDAHPLFREEKPGTGKVAYSLGLIVPDSVSGTMPTGND